MRATLLLACAVAGETDKYNYASWPCVGHCPGHARAIKMVFLNIDNDLYEGALDVLERLRERFVIGTRLHFHELVEFQRGRCGDDMKCVRPDQEMRALYRFLRRHPCIGLALDSVRGGRPRAQPVVFVVARTECE